MTHMAIVFLLFLCFDLKKGMRDADPRLWSCPTNGCFLLAIDPLVVGEMPLWAPILFAVPLVALWGNCIALLIYMLFVEVC